MNLTKNHYSRRALALLLTLVMCVGMIPTAFAAQQNSYHDPAEHWMQASGRMLVLVGAIKMSDRIIRELMGLG